jgi:hypothetical protein
MEKVLQEEFDFAYKLFNKVLSVELSQPTLYFGDEHLSKFHTYNSINSWAHNSRTNMIYEGEGIYVASKMMKKSKGERIFGFLHELGHAFVRNNNPKIENIDYLWETDRDRGNVYHAFKEGAADHIAIICCSQSGEEEIILRGQRKAKLLDSILESWINDKDVYETAQIYAEHFGKDTIDENGNINWEETAITYFSREKMLGQIHFSYIMGRHFMKNVIDKVDIVDLIRNPPQSIRELVCPETYLESINY